MSFVSFTGLFLSSFIFVLLLGLQTKAVSNSNKIQAVAVALLLGVCNIFLFKVLPTLPLFGWGAFLYLIGAPVGALTAIYLNKE